MLAAVVDRLNAARSAAGLAPLDRHSLLDPGAQAHSADMARRNRLTHLGPAGETPLQLISATGYPVGAWATNIAQGHHTADGVVAAWMASPGHRANILNALVTDVGVGVAYSAGGTAYWTVYFAAAR